MKKVILLGLILLSIVSCKPKGGNAWTKEYEEKNYNEVYNSLGTVIQNPDARKKFAEYTISTLKKKLPQGLESISSDSLYKLSTAIGKEYASQGRLNAAIAWTPQIEASFRKGMLEKVALKIHDKAEQEKFCDCVMARFKKMNPDSLTLPIPDSVITSLASACIKQQ